MGVGFLFALPVGFIPRHTRGASSANRVACQFKGVFDGLHKAGIGVPAEERQQATVERGGFGQLSSHCQVI